MTQEEKLFKVLYNAILIIRDKSKSPKMRLTRYEKMLHSHYDKPSVLVKTLIKSNSASGYIDLYDNNLLQYSIENIALHKDFRSMFTPSELEYCEKKLTSLTDRNIDDLFTKKELTDDI